MNGKIVLLALISVLFTSVVVETQVVVSVKAEPSESEPDVEFIDLYNGTTLILIDYHNGTIVEGRITHYPSEGFLQPLEGLENQSSRVEIPIVKGGNQCINDPSVSQDILFGFTWSWNATEVVELGPYKIEIGLGFDFGLRLPVRITLDYPETMLSNEDYTINATLNTLDWTDWQEFLLYLYCSVDSIEIPLFDRSESFETPLGPDVPIPLPEIGPFHVYTFDFFLGGIGIGFSIVPELCCNRIEATADVTGNASIIGSPSMSWTTPGEKIPLNIHTSDVSDSGSTLISINDFKYVIDKFLFDFDFVIDPYGILDWIPNYEHTLFTWDAGDFLPDLILGIHPVYPESIGVNMFVEREHEPFLHDLAITNVTTSSHAVYQGELVQIFVSAENKGNATETFAVIAYYNNQSIGARIVEALTPGENASLIFNWDTKDVVQGYWYSIKAEATVIADEIDITNNLYIGGAVKIRGIGDVTDDGIVDIDDLVVAALSFGSYPEHPRWNPIADLNEDEIVDIDDIVTIAIHFGETL